MDTKNTIIEPLPTAPTTRQWRYYSYDVWGNADDGYDVNDVFRTSDIVELPIEPMCDVDLFAHLVECGFFHGKGLRSSQFETDGDEETIYITYKGRPEGEFRLETPEA